jgi:predicted short-subunit dehydrogenase-like oxidoreductase (DUF2520 family)
MQIAIVGTGNVAQTLVKLFTTKGIAIGQIVGRNQSATRALAKIAGAKTAASLGELLPTIEVVYLAVSDDYLIELNKHKSLKNKIIIHTAGSRSVLLFANQTADCGVFYPLQSLSKASKKLPEIPWLCDWTSPAAKKVLTQVCHKLGVKLNRVGDEQRLQLHLAAVLVNNFTNHLYAQAFAICQQSGLDFGLLLPIIHQTAQRLGKQDPRQWQTGPALRGDQKTIKTHLALLHSNPKLAQLYRLISSSIREST